ncbi:serine/threonine-protein kinase [Dactylosporangium sp. CS-033363]|uniref:serine/threonine-protein kinase n=1 Tax=Dactylosporangium sp. CS-033363 TaxID=3239935 RepID=UPI003D8DE819
MDAGQLLNGRYLLAEQLGEGGMSVVWRARDLVLDRAVAVKVLNSRLAADDDWRRRIRLEAQAAARLTHPNITSVYDYGETSDQVPFVVMELLRGPTLAERLLHGPLPTPAALRICAEVAAGLAAAHAEDLVHRDVKPANVILTPDAAKVLDFGIVGFVGVPDIDEGSPQVLGTPAYLAPERLVAGEITTASDVYAFGLLLYRCLTGRLPWDSETTTQMVMAHMTVAPAPLPELADLPADVRELCMQCLAKEPRRRPEAVVVAARLARAAGIVPRFSVVLQEPAPGTAQPDDSTELVALPLLPGVSADATEPVEHPGDRRRVLLGVGALVAIAALLTGVALRGSGEEPTSTADPLRPAPVITQPAPSSASSEPAPPEPPPSAEPAATEPPASTAATPAGDDRTTPGRSSTSVTTAGGTVVALCVGQKVSLVGVFPASGAQVVRADLGVHTKAQVEFRKRGERLRYDVECAGGAPVATEH